METSTSVTTPSAGPAGVPSSVLRATVAVPAVSGPQGTRPSRGRIGGAVGGARAAHLPAAARPVLDVRPVLDAEPTVGDALRGVDAFRGPLAWSPPV